MALPFETDPRNCVNRMCKREMKKNILGQLIAGKIGRKKGVGMNKILSRSPEQNMEDLQIELGKKNLEKEGN